jgi:uncharacterized protein (DUF952 family)
MAVIYNICPAALWGSAISSWVFRGSPLDLADGYIHFSALAQVRETADRHFAGQGNLVIVAFEEEMLGDGLRYEAARGGQMFPHLFGTLDPRLALWAQPLPLGADGRHVFPDLSP